MRQHRREMGLNHITISIVLLVGLPFGGIEAASDVNSAIDKAPAPNGDRFLEATSDVNSDIDKAPRAPKAPNDPNGDRSLGLLATLDRLRLHKYRDVFENADIVDDSTLGLLTKDDLDQLGLPLGPRVIIRDELRRRKRDGRHGQDEATSKCSCDEEALNQMLEEREEQLLQTILAAVTKDEAEGGLQHDRVHSIAAHRRAEENSAESSLETPQLTSLWLKGGGSSIAWGDDKRVSLSRAQPDGDHSMSRLRTPNTLQAANVVTSLANLNELHEAAEALQAELQEKTTLLQESLQAMNNTIFSSNGAFKIPDGTACTDETEGTLRYRSHGGGLEICRGDATGWAGPKVAWGSSAAPKPDWLADACGDNSDEMAMSSGKDMLFCKYSESVLWDVAAARAPIGWRMCRQSEWKARFASMPSHTAGGFVWGDAKNCYWGESSHDESSYQCTQPHGTCHNPEEWGQPIGRNSGQVCGAVGCGNNKWNEGSFCDKLKQASVNFCPCACGETAGSCSGGRLTFTTLADYATRTEQDILAVLQAAVHTWDVPWTSC